MPYVVASQDDAPEITPQTQEAEQGKKGAKQNLDQTQRRISKMRVCIELRVLTATAFCCVVCLCGCFFSPCVVFLLGCRSC